MHESMVFFLSTIAGRTLIVLLALLVGVRVLGRRTVSGMNIYDLVLVLALANAVQNAMTKGSGQLGVGLVAAGALLIADRLLGIAFTKQPWLESKVVGTPTLMVQNGRLLQANMRREGVSEAEVLGAIRSYGLDGLANVKLAVLEADGSLSVVPVK